ncbi:uncharacterized protein LOC116617933 [Nematostella vectensis]|uniref:uncharacterized protein LOC116617933 n=1 Tax=Nematostella vectensis TaxID=45351 RepID=UPI00138FC8E6|nr:uncharacterized protein LOC116617933 [Nematostella vectensis]
MAFSYKYSRLSAFSQMALGFLFFTFGVIERAIFWNPWSVGSKAVLPVWMGMWILGTGLFGFYATKRRETLDRCKLSTYLGFSITSALFGAILALFYWGSAYFNADRWEILCDPKFWESHHLHFTAPSNSSEDSYYHGNLMLRNHTNRILRDHVFTSAACTTKLVVCYLIAILAILEIMVGAWGAVCCCQGNVYCDCCSPQSPMAGQIMYCQSSDDPSATYLTTVVPNEHPEAIPSPPSTDNGHRITNNMAGRGRPEPQPSPDNTEDATHGEVHEDHHLEDDSTVPLV